MAAIFGDPTSANALAMARAPNIFIGALGLDPRALDAVRNEHARPLPHLPY